MIDLGGAALLVVGFVWLLKALRLPRKANEVVAVARRSLTAIRDPDLPDEAKEKALQGYAVREFGLFLYLALGGAAAVLLPAGLVWVLDLAGVLSFDGVMTRAGSWGFIVGSTVIVMLFFWALGRRAE